MQQHRLNKALLDNLMKEIVMIDTNVLNFLKKNINNSLEAYLAMFPIDKYTERLLFHKRWYG